MSEQIDPLIDRLRHAPVDRSLCYDAAIEIAVLRETIKAAMEVAIRYGQIDGAHHKTWVIDQVVKALAGKQYDRVIAEACAGEDGPETYLWDQGIAP